MVDREIRKHDVKPKKLRKRRRGKVTSLFLIGVRIKSLIAIRTLILAGQKSFASTWTLQQQKTTHTVPHGMKERDTKKYGQ